MKEFLLQLSKLIGTKEDATEQEVLEALTLLKNKAENPEIKMVLSQEVIDFLEVQDVVDALELKAGATVSDVKATVLALKQGAEAVQSLELKKLQSKIADMEAVTLVNSAMNEGKVTAAQKDWAMKYAADDPEGFAVYVSKATRVVPMDPAPKGSKDVPQLADETTLELAGIFGNSKKDLAEFGGLKEAT